jgi:tripartite-type tricarboxylate transporter receptor subunit TctC
LREAGRKREDDMMLLSRFAPIAVAAALAALPAAAQAQGFTPEREIRVICGYAAGTGADVIVRFFSEKIRPFTGGKPVVVENKPGALTQIAAEGVKNAKPDGYTLFITAGNSTMASNPHLFKQIKYDPLKDFTPVTTLIKLPFVFVVAPKSPINSMKDLAAHLKTKGDKASYGYPNTFSLAATELYKQKLGLATVGVAYSATPQAMPDLVNGQIDFVMSDATFLLNQSRQGLVKALAVTTAERASVAPDLPGMAEVGVAGFDLSAWWGAWLPPGAPTSIVNTYADWLNKVVTMPETKEFLNKSGADPWLGTPQVLADFTATDMKRWGEIIKLAKIEPQ